MRRLALAFVIALVSLPSATAWSQGVDVGTLRIYLARHGQSTYNVEGWSTGWFDAPLTSLGRQQARELAEVLRGIDVDAIYSSTLSRSRDTARTAAGGREVVSLPGLRERNWGVFTGKPNNDPEFLRRRFVPGDTLNGGETEDAFFERVRDSIAEIRRQHPTGNVLVVGHQATNQQVIRALLGLSDEEARMITQENDEVYALDFLPGRTPLLWKLIRARNLSDL